MTLYQEILIEIKPLIRSRAFSLYRADEEHNLGGPKVQELEELFREYHDCKHAIAVSSATAGLHISLLARGITGKEVVTTPVTFSATASAIVMAGNRPVFRDIEASTYCLEPTEAPYLLPVHLHGHPADMEDYRGLVIEDAAQALGAIYKGKKVGTIGKVGVFSFNQHKQIQCGEGGMIITNDDQVATQARLLRNHGETQSNALGYNYRMTELQAAVVIPQFKRIEQSLTDTIELCETLTLELKNVPELEPPVVRPDCRHVYYTYPVRVKGIDRDELQRRLLSARVYFGRGGYRPLYLFPFYSMFGAKCRNADDCYRNVMFSNIFKPPMRVRQVRRIARIIKDTVWQIKKESTIL